MNRTRNLTHSSLFYLCSYLLLGGLLLLVFPAEGLTLFLSTGNYGDVFPRVAGMLLVGLGLIVVAIIRTRSEAMYPATLVVRAFFLVCLAAFYVAYRDPLFIVLFAIVGFGAVLTLTSYSLDRRQPD